MVETVLGRWPEGRAARKCLWSRVLPAQPSCEWTRCRAAGGHWDRCRISAGAVAPDVFFLYKFMYLFLAALGLRYCTWAFSSCGERGLFVAVRGLLIVVASLVVEHGL